MFKNYFKIALRNLKRNFTFSLINILGLTLGLSIALLIFLFVANELTYDRFHKDVERIYRIDSWLKAMDRELSVSTTCGPMGPYLNENYPHVLNQVRMSYADYLVLENENQLFEDDIYYVDPSFFEMFTIEVIHGNPEVFLDEPFSLVMTRNMARKYFGDVDPLGRVLKANNGKNYTVTGVIEEWPENSHIKYQMMSSFESQLALEHMGPPIDSWLGFNHRTYIKLAEGYPPEKLQAEFPGIIEKFVQSDPFAQQFDFEIRFSLMPMKKIHLYSNIDGETEPGGDFTTILIYAAIGIFILLIACINFMNLTTARSSRRLREVGIRKVVGAQRKQLIWQFITESVFISLISLVLAATLAELLLPEFNNLVGKELSFDYIHDWPLTLGFIVLAIVVGLVAGSYPALYLSNFKPIAILHGKMKLGSGSSFFRNFLVAFQFIISIILITCTIVVYMQLGFVRNADMGFNPEQVLVVPLRGDKMRQNPELLQSELKQIPDIGKTSVVSGFPGRSRIETMFWFEGYERDEGKVLPLYEVDDQFFELLDIGLLMGRNFNKENALDANSLIINQALAKQLGWENPIGKTIEMMDFVDNQPAERSFKVVGLVADYNCKSLHSPLEPIVFRTKGIEMNYLLAKVNKQNTDETRAKIEKVFSGIDQSWPFNSYFMDGQFERFYLNEVKQGKIFMYFAFFAIFIAALGLFGLTAFIAEQRTKEIGIRKILGSSVSQIVTRLSMTFIRLVLIAAIVAIPISWYLMYQWLQAFAYKVQMSWWIFALSTLLALMIALLTILHQSLKAARVNPVRAISYE